MKKILLLAAVLAAVLVEVRYNSSPAPGEVAIQDPSGCESACDLSALEDSAAFHENAEFNVSLGIPVAHASDDWQAALTSTDAGSTNTTGLTRTRQYAIQCTSPACYKTGSATGIAADCTKDYMLPVLAYTAAPDGGNTALYPSLWGRDFASASKSFVAARAVDGGNPACKLFIRTE